MHPSLSKAAIMRAAWALFRKTYRFPNIPFVGIGRACFGWALKEAWRQAREAARIAAIPLTEKLSIVPRLQYDLEALAYVESFRTAEGQCARIRGELHRLAA